MTLTPPLHFISQACIYGGPCLHRHQAGVLREPELQSLQGARGDRAPPPHSRLILHLSLLLTLCPSYTTHILNLWHAFLLLSLGKLLLIKKIFLIKKTFHEHTKIENIPAYAWPS